MNVLNSLGSLAGDNLSRVDSGQGQISERTIKLGENIIVIDNIGSMRVFDVKKSFGTAIIGGISTLLGVVILSSGSLAGLFFILIGIALIAWNLTKKGEIYLSIGTCDGRSSIIVSKDRKFLSEIREFIQKKIDTQSTNSAIININNSTLEGTIAVGPDARAYSSEEL